VSGHFACRLWFVVAHVCSLVGVCGDRSCRGSNFSFLSCAMRSFVRVGCPAGNVCLNKGRFVGRPPPPRRRQPTMMFRKPILRSLPVSMDEADSKAAGDADLVLWTRRTSLTY